MFVLSACQGIAISYAPLSAISPFAGVSMVWSVSFGSCGMCGLPRERLRPLDMCAVLLVLSGAVAVSVSDTLGAHSELSREDLIIDARRPLFIGYWIVNVIQ